MGWLLGLDVQELTVGRLVRNGGIRIVGLERDAGAKRVLLPMASVGDIPTIPGELFAKFQTNFYSDPRDAVFKALGVQ